MDAPLVPVAVPDRLVNPEFELLRACCHSNPELLTATLERNLNWESVLNLASYHRLLPALYTRLHDRNDVPASIQSVLSARFITHCQRTMRFSAALVQVLKHFEAAGIPVIAQKGPVLAHKLYGDSAMREFGDLDVLVRQRDVRKASAALGELGYERNLELSPGQEKAYLRSGYEYVFGRGAERNLVELQWNLLPRFYAVDVSVDDLFRRSVQQDFEGCRARVLSPEDQMLFLCVHAAKHQWAQLGMVRDIAAISSRGVKWDWVFDEAGRLGIQRILAISLLLASELLGAELPVQVDVLPEGARCKRLVSTMKSSWVKGGELHSESAAYFRLMLQVRERWQERARFLWRLAVTPSVEEWKSVQVPDAMFPFYSCVRFGRLLRRAIS
jgi:hypothetical protein